MKSALLFILLTTIANTSIFSQSCGATQNLSTNQQATITNIIQSLDAALKPENLAQIDSLNNELKIAYSSQAGIPDAAESHYSLNANNSWLDISKSILLSRALVAADSAIYANLWKAGKGMSPPSYQPNSLFLRAAAEIAAGLLKIADKETDSSLKNLYQNWATRALDSLATMQLPNGAFPFPDLRTYGDPVFTPIIQNFLRSCGADSVNVLQNGWITDDKQSGEFKYDAGVIANAYYEAFLYTGITHYQNIAIAIGNYLKPLKFNTNYNYNTFASLGLTRAFQLTNDTSYLNRAITTLRYSVSPGQIENGRWVDGHNANSRYHNIIIQNITPTIALIPISNPHRIILAQMTHKAIKNLIDYTYTCKSATGYRWLIKAFSTNPEIINPTLKDSIENLIGQHINQSAVNGKYLDIPTMGDYFELLELTSKVETNTNRNDLEFDILPNPANTSVKIVYDIPANASSQLIITDISGKILKYIKSTLTNCDSEIDLSEFLPGIYLTTLNTSTKISTKKLIIAR